MNKRQNDLKVYFCGISKNCINNIEKNLIFLDAFNKKSSFDTKIIIVDSDSVDGTKEIISNYVKENKEIEFINFDLKKDNIENRIERIAKSRNECLKQIDNFNKETVYIPLDLDIDLFANTNLEEIEKLINKAIYFKKNNAIFPFSTPFYYDIFALRAENWVKINSQYWVTRLKKYLKFGSFFFNYFFIFRHQIRKNDIKSDTIKVKSAFGGMGIYYFRFYPKNLKYKISSKYPLDISEHIIFNSDFNLLFIEKNWNIPAPPEHLEYKLLTNKQKLKYFLRSLLYDIKN